MLQVLLWRGRPWDPVDLAIMAWTRSLYSHVGWVLDGEVLEVVRTGSRALPLSAYPRGYDLAEFVPGPPRIERQVTELEAVVASRRGRDVPYDRAAIAGIVLRGLTGFHWCFLDQEGHETCAEAVASDARLVGLELAASPPCASPGEIARSPLLRIVRRVR